MSRASSTSFSFSRSTTSFGRPARRMTRLPACPSCCRSRTPPSPCPSGAARSPSARRWLPSASRTPRIPFPPRRSRPARRAGRPGTSRRRTPARCDTSAAEATRFWRGPASVSTVTSTFASGGTVNSDRIVRMARTSSCSEANRAAAAGILPCRHGRRVGLGHDRIGVPRKRLVDLFRDHGKEGMRQAQGLFQDGKQERARSGPSPRRRRSATAWPPRCTSRRNRSR